MGEIIVLPDEVSGKIAAGEVIDRPVSVVKELIENSIDAGAENIEIYIEKGGKKLIEVRDDGEGILKEDLPLVFLRHSTSKIKKIKDLESVKTMGFRGEALTSISEISKTTIISSKNGSDEAYKIVCLAGKLSHTEPAPYYRGTIVKVEDLFFNLPARKNFLRADETEFHYIKELIKKLSVAFPEISFSLFHNKKKVFSFLKTKNLTTRVEAVFDEKFFNKYFYTEFSIGDIKVKAFLTKPGLSEYRKEPQWLFVNRRIAKERVIQKVINSSFSGFLQRGTYPGYLFFIELPDGEIEVNIHPKKEEVRVKNAKRLFEALRSVLRRAIENNLKENYPHNKSYDEKEFASYIYKNERFHNNQFLLTLEKKEDELKKTFSLFVREHEEEEFKIYGQFLDSYIIAEKSEKILIIDQHNAEERINYDRLKNEYINGKTYSIEPLFPIIIDDEEITDELYDKLIFLKNFGWEIEPWGENSLIVKKFPYIFTEQNIQEFLKDYFKNKENEQPEERILKLMACKASIKINTPISIDKMKEIVKKLFHSSNPYLCPHSRPIIVEIDEDYIMKMLKRK